MNEDALANRRRAWASPFGWVLAWAAVAMLCLVAAMYFFGRQRDYAHQMMRMREEMRRQNIELTHSSEAFAILGRRDTLESPLGLAGGGKLYINPTGGLLLVVSGLPPSGPGKAYQMWVVPVSGKPVPAGTFRVGAGGAAWHVRAGPVDLSGTRRIEVTLEDEGGAAQPSSEPVVSVGLAAK